MCLARLRRMRLRAAGAGQMSHARSTFDLDTRITDDVTYSEEAWV